MTSAPYLDNYLENLEKLPEEIQKNFTLMRNLDSRQQELTHEIDKEADNHMSYLKGHSRDKKNASTLSIQRKFDKVKEYGDDKVQLAIQTYELVDRQIRKLDINLARFEAEIASRAINAKGNAEVGSQKREDKKTKDNETKKQSASREKETMAKTSKKKPLKKGGAKITSTAPTKIPSIKIVDNLTKTTNSVAVEVAVESGSLAGALVGAGVNHSAEVLDMPVDPNEPTYCLCNQVSFGEMIGCDNPDCPIEWFHFACVKLRTKPKGKWFCSNCLTDMKKK